MDADFNAILERVSVAARRGLDQVTPEAGKISIAVPAGLLLLADDPAAGDAFREGCRELARLGRGQPDPQLSAATPGLPSTPGSPASPGTAHHRRIYHLLALHLHLAAFQLRYETLPPAVWASCEDLLADAMLPARGAEAFAGGAPPADQTHFVLWQALCLLEYAHVTSRDVDVELVDSIVHRIVEQPDAGEALTIQDPEESPDAWAYRELVGLHALANLAVQRRSTPWSARVARVARYHQENTQPDHTTSEPWALFAFAWTPDTRGMADQLLHASATYGLTVTGALLLADAHAAMSRFA